MGKVTDRDIIKKSIELIGIIDDKPMKIIENKHSMICGNRKFLFDERDNRRRVEEQVADEWYVLGSAPRDDNAPLKTVGGKS